MAPAKPKRNFRQLTLEQSVMCLSVAIDSSFAMKPLTKNPGKVESRPTRHISADTSESSGDEFSEPDPDSSDEWLPSTGNSRASSPDASPGRRKGGKS